MTSLHLLLITTKSNVWPSIHFSICVRCALCSYVTLLGRLTWLTVTLHSNPTHTLCQNGETVHKREIMHTTPQTWSPQPWHPNLTTFKKIINYIILNFNYLPKARSALNWAKSLMDCKLSSAFWKICTVTNGQTQELIFEEVSSRSNLAVEYLSVCCPPLLRIYKVTRAGYGNVWGALIGGKTPLRKLVALWGKTCYSSWHMYLPNLLQQNLQK